MSRVFVIGLLAICAGCSSGSKNAAAAAGDPLVGKYVGWQVMGSEASALDGKIGITEKLELKADGTFHYVLDSNVMVTIASQADGTYKHVGNDVTLTGTMKGTADDGYKKSDQSGPYTSTLKVENGSLVDKTKAGMERYYRIEGLGPPTLPGKPKLKEADSGAVTMLKAVEKTYASLKSFTTTGTVESKGKGFAPEKVKFKVWYQSPSKFRFEAAKLDGEKEFDRTEMTWNGDKCWWYTKEFGETTDRGLGNALSIIGVGFGAEASFLPNLLMPRELGAESLAKRYPEITFLPTETINGKRCMVLQLRGKDSDVAKLWVAEETGMIVRYYEGIREETVTLDSKMDTPINEKAFNFGKRSAVN